ncbi:MAG: RelA/SpoT domain-containing protein [Prevotellaceae bacterium]|jgi:ppGpp synthetase/RelA/SpoT-type nucleotidyltranferase|nr:RelA/SpoT domain-containing protein [Prevotellaceae bacterium]
MNNNITGLANILTNIQKEILSEIDRIGIHCRVHARIKDFDSLKEKIDRKEKEGKGYSENGKKVQDILGFRITTYFIEDVKLLWDIFERKYEKVDEANDKINKENFKVFEPVHKNMVCRMNKENSTTLNEIKFTEKEIVFNLIDNTFEIQFRTTLSEGWHEIDHVLRYKCKSDWEDFIEAERMLNGIYATLETSDNALKSLFEDLSYQHYKKQNWEAMLRTKFRLKFIKEHLDNDISDILNSNNELAKSIFRIDRQRVIEKVALSKLHMPLSFNNIVYLLNYLEMKNSEIEQLLPINIKSDFETYLNIE